MTALGILGGALGFAGRGALGAAKLEGKTMKTKTARVPMLWADSLTVTPLDDHYFGKEGEEYEGDGGNPEMLHFKTCRLHVNYSNDPIHYSRIKCSWTPKLEQEYIQVGSLFWKDETKIGAAQYNDSAEFLALPTQKYARRSLTADIQYSIAFYMNPTHPGCLPQWCDTALPIPKNASATLREEEEYKLLGSVNNAPVELFPACEYKSLQDVFCCLLEYSDDSTEWIKACEFDITGGRVTHTLQMPDESGKPHQFWRFNLKGFSTPADPNNEHADRGFYTFGRLWEVLVWVARYAETKKTVSWQKDKEILLETEYTFTATTPDHWKINTSEPLLIDLSLFPSIENGLLYYKAGSGEWKNLGSFTSEKRVTIPAEDLQILINPDVLSAEQGSGQSPKNFYLSC